MRPASIQEQYSAGGVIFRQREGAGTEVAMISVKGGRVWSLPKGIIDKGETPQQTAIREVQEETGLRGSVIDEIGKTRYWYYMREKNARCCKTVTFFLMRYEGGDTADHDHEVDDAEWFPIPEAMERATYKGDREIIKKAMEMLGRERARTGLGQA